MFRLIAVAGIALSSFAVVAQSTDSPFDRSAEVAKYIETIGAGTRNTLIETARDIHDADIEDVRLAKALRDKLQSDLPTLNLKDSVDNKYRKWMVAAMASTGVKEIAPDVKKMCAGIRTNAGSTYCDADAEKIDWYQLRNRTAVSGKYCHPGDDRKLCGIMNLLMSDDYSLKHEGVNRMNWGKIFDPGLLDAMEPQVLSFIGDKKRSSSHMELDTIASFVKLLGYSGNPKYRDTLQKASGYSASMSIQRRAREGLKRLSK